ncbi:MAG: DNA repair protein RecN [Lentisphaerae bacterium]|jgi:DNA repair protein RecN (Recombination protein N)|nr:DNA repair protein RecN [Lentisphaerota bacterium]
MLSYITVIEKLTVKDLAVVESAEINFSAGLNVVTGETGAGKSVLVGAINLLCGERADNSLIRRGANQSTVMAEISLSPAANEIITPILEDSGIDPCEDGLLILRRTISTTGSSRGMVNNCPATVQTLKRIGEHIVDLHGAHDNQSLFNPMFQLEALDSFGKCFEKRNKFATLWREKRGLVKQREELAGVGESAERELDLLKYQIKEIEEANLSVDEDGEALIAEHATISNSSALLEMAGTTTQMLTDAEGSVTEILAELIRNIEGMSALGCAEAPAWLDEARSASIQLNELSQSITSVFSAIDASPERMLWLEERMTTVQRLKRKYGNSIENILDFYEKTKERVDELESREYKIEQLDKKIAEQEKLLSESAQILSKSRKAASGKFAEAVSQQLADLGLPNAAISISITPAAIDTETGRDHVEFEFAPNLGESVLPLRNIASSGEISRVMLALKSVLAEHDKIPILVFDEIDANIGGEIANNVGAKMATASETHQIICITHLPQVAAWGRCHFVVSKSVEEGRTHTRIEPVDQADRIDEIARMLGGAGLTSVTIEHARELLSRQGNR